MITSSACVSRANQLINSMQFIFHLHTNRFGQDCNGDGRIDCYDHALIHYRGGYGCKGDLPEKYNGVFTQCLNNFLAGK